MREIGNRASKTNTLSRTTKQVVQALDLGPALSVLTFWVLVLALVLVLVFWRALQGGHD